MLILRPTAVLAKRAKLRVSDLPISQTHPAADWMITEITAQRKRYILATNTATLLSVHFSGKGVVNEATSLAALFRAFQEQLPGFGFEKQYREWIVPELSLVGFVKSTNRSVRGSMNDFIAQTKSWFEDGIFDLTRIAYGLNQSPMTMIAMENPLTVFPKLAR